MYYAQLEDRLRRQNIVGRAQLNLPPVQGSRASTIEDAAKCIEVSKQPRVTMADWVDLAAKRNPIAASTEDIARAEPPTSIADQFAPVSSLLVIKNGWLTIDGTVLAGGQMGVPWWNGSIRPADLTKASSALTRFVPGRIGTGLTDDLNEVVKRMIERGTVAVYQHPPLWYERRRDDHERVRRLDGDVVAPFYETPWERTGVGSASDGLSKWDITKPNKWYFARLRQFADLGARNGLILFNGLYMQHNVLEAGAHYADAPWRPANNINPVGIPEPVFFAGDKLIYVAEQFYDVSNPERAALHRAYMRAALNELADKPNVIFYLSEEYTGPLAFTQFWLDTVAQWSAETGKHPTIALYAPKDVTDAILSDPKRAAVVSLIYNSFDPGNAGFWIQPSGKWYAPEGGKNLAPRQWIRQLQPKSPGFDQVYQVIREYRTKYPDKPFVYDGSNELAWAVLMGGGSMPKLPKTTDREFLKAVAAMKPGEVGTSLVADDGSMVVYVGKNGGPSPAMKPGPYEARVVHLKDGTLGPATRIDDTSKPTAVLTDGSPSIIWYRKLEK
ncbi:MAG: DUF6298 domain-containing protein [Tepidisphaeraceae bacterium]